MDKEEAIKMKALEKFMERVAEIVGCLPSYSDPHPNSGNTHIIKQLRYLTSSIHSDGEGLPVLEGIDYQVEHVDFETIKLIHRR